MAEPFIAAIRGPSCLWYSPLSFSQSPTASGTLVPGDAWE